MSRHHNNLLLLVIWDPSEELSESTTSDRNILQNYVKTIENDGYDVK
jgi:hypothetical protein